MSRKAKLKVDEHAPPFQEDQQYQAPPGLKAPPGNNFRVRAVWSCVMIVCFCGVVAAGPFFCCLLILGIKVGMFSEVTRLKRDQEKENKLPLTNFLNWYIFWVAQSLIALKFVIYRFPYLLARHEWMLRLAHYHNFIFLALGLAGFLGFVVSLQEGCYRFQFRLLGWTVFLIAFVNIPLGVVYSTVYSGRAWFLTPALLIIVNDIFAYLVGITIGRTKLIDISPKKTVEGFAGGTFFTFLASFAISNLIQRLEFLHCSGGIFQQTACTVPELFLPGSSISLLGSQFLVSQFQLHCLAFSVFASLIGPFGGFFASGFKRSVNVKDFGNTIPGHGGFLDRFDCQILMLIFVYFYMSSFVEGGWQEQTVRQLLKELGASRAAVLLSQIK